MSNKAINRTKIESPFQVTQKRPDILEFINQNGLKEKIFIQNKSMTRCMSPFKN